MFIRVSDTTKENLIFWNFMNYDGTHARTTLNIWWGDWHIVVHLNHKSWFDHKDSTDPSPATSACRGGEQTHERDNYFCWSTPHHWQRRAMIIP